MIALVVDSALRTLLVAGVAGVVLGALRVRNPYVLKTLWTAVLSVGLLMPLLLHCRIITAPISSAGWTVSRQVGMRVSPHLLIRCGRISLASRRRASPACQPA